jgi:DNA-binding NarL/FixJ family response regulator
MSVVTREATIVVLLDWQGRVVWISSENPRRDPGQAAEEYVRADDRAKVHEAVTQVVQHRRSQQLQVVNDVGDHYRAWLWPLDSPDVAVCALCIHVPEELALLTNREQDCLKLLAYGLTVEKIAERLQIAVSTVHTHFRRAREKLNLPSLEALISFAARHCDTFANSPIELTLQQDD